MLNKLKANILFHALLKRPDITQAYKMVGPEDSWYDTISTVHRSLAQIRQLPHEDLEITSHDGLRLKAVYYPCEGSKKTMIWIHGYTSHAERESAFPSLFYRSLGFNVLIPYLRAHGPSEGKYIAFGPLETLDLMAWVELINEKHPHGQIVFHGLSMGGGIALDLATQEMKNVKCLIVDAPSCSIESLLFNASKHTYKRTYHKVYPYMCRCYQKEFGVDPLLFDRLKNIENGRYPLLLSAGSNEDMEDILEEIRFNNPHESTVVILPGCNHGNGMYKQTEMYQSAIKAFLEEHLSCLN